MPKTVRKDQPHPVTERGTGLVRTERAIPTLSRVPDLPTPGPAVGTTQCEGRCGHCHVHPCQLHAPV